MSETDFEAFYERHWKYVYRLCFSYMKNPAEAEDCTEDVFVKVLSGRHRFEDETHERKWLTVTAMNLCKDRLKSHARKHTISLYDDSVQEPECEEKEDLGYVTEAVLKLPVKLKDVVWLYYYDGLTAEEAARLLHRPPSTVRNQLRDARKLLGDILRDDI